MTAPRRLQLRRTKGWRMPEGAIKVDRTTKWGNWFKVITVASKYNDSYRAALPDPNALLVVQIDKWGMRTGSQWGGFADKAEATAFAVDLHARAMRATRVDLDGGPVRDGPPHRAHRRPGQLDPLGATLMDAFEWIPVFDAIRDRRIGYSAGEGDFVVASVTRAADGKILAMSPSGNRYSHVDPDGTVKVRRLAPASPERTFTVVAEITTELSDDQILDLAKRYREAEDGTVDFAFPTVDDAIGEIIEFGLIYGQGLGNPTRLPGEDDFTLGTTEWHHGGIGDDR